MQPMSLDMCFDALASSSSHPTKLKAALSLFTVAHHPTVKQALLQRTDVVRSLALLALDRSQDGESSRWVALATIGELCRREQREDSMHSDVVNTVSRSVIQYLTEQTPWFYSGLQDIVAASADEDTVAVAEDLIAALPHDRLEDWTKAAKEKCKDLLFLDPHLTDRTSVGLSHVARASPYKCSHCGKECSKALQPEGSAAPLFPSCAQCHAVFYCCAECQKAHWKAGHKIVCSKWVKEHDASVFPVLFYETREFLYSARPDALKDCDFEQYFMTYAPVYSQ